MKYKCIYCERLLFMGRFTGVIEIKCSKCKTLNIKKSAKEERHENS
jgi:LSD1 subclass zinc finger protein